tara:strand:+ start:1715 stop:2305 length:591 start_codon:yes stop_codon:yes gene_type:complete
VFINSTREVKMSNETPSNPDVKSDSTNAEGVNETAQGTKAETNDTIPRARLNEEIAKRKELDARLSEFEKAKEIEAQKKLEEEGEYKTILSNKDAEIERLKPFEEELVKWKKEQRDEILSTMSEADREEFGDLPYGQLKKVARRLNVNEKSVPVDVEKPSQRQFQETGVGDFRDSTKGLSAKQRQSKWTDFLKSQK